MEGGSVVRWRGRRGEGGKEGGDEREGGSGGWGWGGVLPTILSTFQRVLLTLFFLLFFRPKPCLGSTRIFKYTGCVVFTDLPECFQRL